MNYAKFQKDVQTVFENITQANPTWQFGLEEVGKAKMYILYNYNKKDITLVKNIFECFFKNKSTVSRILSPEALYGLKEITGYFIPAYQQVVYCDIQTEIATLSSECPNQFSIKPVGYDCLKIIFDNQYSHIDNEYFFTEEELNYYLSDFEKNKLTKEVLNKDLLLIKEKELL